MTSARNVHTAAIRLPLVPVESETPSRAADAPTRKTIRHPARIMVVDDNVEYATLLAEALAEMGFHVCHVHDGPSALRVADEFVPNVALVDIGLK